MAVKPMLRDGWQSRQHSRMAYSVGVQCVKRRDGHIDAYGPDLMAMKDLAIMCLLGRELGRRGGKFIPY